VTRRRASGGRDALGLGPWIDLLDVYGEHFDAAVRSRRRADVEWAAGWMARTAGWLLREVGRAVRSFQARNPPRPVPLELLERDFLRLREQAELAAARAAKAARGWGKAAAKARRAADDAARATTAFARAMRAEIDRRGLWSEKLGRELGLAPWL